MVKTSVAAKLLKIPAPEIVFRTTTPINADGFSPATTDRFTKDMDLFIKADPENARATHAALAEFGALLQGIRPEDLIDRNSFFRFGREPRGFDILPAIPGVDFDAAWGKARCNRG
jgi:hypothetical protein